MNSKYIEYRPTLSHFYAIYIYDYVLGLNLRRSIQALSRIIYYKIVYHLLLRERMNDTCK